MYENCYQNLTQQCEAKVSEASSLIKHNSGKREEVS